MENTAVFISDTTIEKGSMLTDLMQKGWTLKSTIRHEETSETYAGWMYILERKISNTNLY